MMQTSFTLLFFLLATFTQAQDISSETNKPDTHWQIDTTIRQHAFYEAGDTALINFLIKNIAGGETDDDFCFSSKGIIALRIDEHGNVKETKVIRSICLLFDKQLINVVKGITFKPAIKNGKPVEDLLYIPVKIRLH
jgi:hypothetical protein